MKKLMNLAIASGLFVHGFHEDYEEVQRFVDAHDLDGVEMILYGDYSVEAMPVELIHGHHLLYWPNWLNFWKGDQAALLKDFLEEENIRSYYGMDSKDDMIDYYKKEFEISKAVNADYMVYHVSHASFDEVFKFEHKYSDKEVMCASIELLNQVFTGEGPMLLFENLWLPGLNYQDVELTQWYLKQITYKNKGLLLDIAHLMATNPLIRTMDEGIDYVHQVLDDLGDLIHDIKVIHLNKTIAGPYLQEDHKDRNQAFMDKKDMMEGFRLIDAHISQIDSHMPFNHGRIMEIIDRVQPEAVVYELKADSLEVLSERIKLQNRYITR